MSFGQDVLSGVQVPVVQGAAGGARPVPCSQGKLRKEVSAVGAQFRRREEPVNDHQGPPIPGGLVLQLPAELAPPGITDRFREVVVANHVPHRQILNDDQIVAANHASAGLVEEVPAGVGDPGIRFRDPGFGLAPVLRSLGLAGHHPLVAGQSLFLAAQDLRMRDPFTVGGDHEVLEPKVDANGRPNWGQCFDVLVDEHGDMPASGGVPGHGHRGWSTSVGQGPRPDDRKGFGEFRDAQHTITECECLVGVLHGLVAVPILEPWVPGALGEEVPECRLLVPQALLEWA